MCCSGAAYHDLRPVKESARSLYSPAVRLKRSRATRQDVLAFLAWQDDERMLREIAAKPEPMY